jgi:hypothetical protein
MTSPANIVQQIAPQGPPGPLAASVVNPAALAALATTTFVAGTVAYVQSLKTTFTLDPTSAATADNVYFIAAQGGGNWVSVRAVPSTFSLALQQGGTVPAPTPEHLFSVQPTDTSKATYSLFIGGASFNGQWDTVFYLGYNADAANVSEPICRLNMEQNFETVPGTFYVEAYFETGLSSAALVRPMGYVLNRSTGAVTTTLSYTSPSFLAIQGGAVGATQQMRWTDGQCFIAPTGYSIQSNNGLTLANLAGTLTLQNAAGQFNVWALGTGSQLYTAADSWAFSDHTTAQHATMDFVGSVARFYPSTDNQGSLGISGGRWASVSAVSGNFSTLMGGGVALASSVGTINVAAGGTFTPAAAVYQNPYITLTGSLAANVTVVLPPTVGANWTLDATACTLNGHTITLQANGVNWATTIGVTNLYDVTYGGAAKLYGVALTP